MVRDILFFFLTKTGQIKHLNDEKKQFSKRMINETILLTNILYMPYKDGRRLLV